MFKWFKKLTTIVSRYDGDLRNAHARISELEMLIRDRTNIAVDVGFREASHVIVIGRYKNADYVQTYDIRTTDMDGLIDQLRLMEKHGVVRRVDAPPRLRGAIKKGLE